MCDLEHPSITQANRTGYPNVVAQDEHFGMDVYKKEIVTGEDYVEDVHNGEIIHHSNLEKYLSEVYGFEFKTAD